MPFVHRIHPEGKEQRNYKEEAQIGKSNSLLSLILTILKLTFRFISIKMYNTNTFSSFLSFSWLIDLNDRNSELTVTRIYLLSTLGVPQQLECCEMFDSKP